MAVAVPTAATAVVKPVIPGCVIANQVGFTEGPVPHAVMADAEQCLVALNSSPAGHLLTDVERASPSLYHGSVWRSVLDLYVYY